MNTLKDQEVSSPSRKRGIVLLPNILTTAALFAGFFSIISAMSQDYFSASIGIYIAMFLDGLDGRVARLLRVESDFGKEFDSLSDMLCFGITPAIVIYQWALSDLNYYGEDLVRLGWVATFIFTVCAACRLARFNANHKIRDKKYFQGLPSPVAASCIAAIIWLSQVYPFPSLMVVIIAVVVPMILGGVMVSNLAYFSFKDFSLIEKVPFGKFLLAPLLMALVAINPPVILLVMFLLYFFASPVIKIIKHIQR
jgi:CDP-diacylglycerol--serine O-phosphatidyltransferase